MRHRFCLILLLLFFFIPVNAFSVWAQGDQTSSRVVRIGYYLFPGLQNKGKNGDYSGYIYDYLQEIAKITHWKYQFIEASYADCLDMLERGELDLVGGLQKTEKRAVVFSFSRYAIGTGYVCLFVDRNDRRFAYGDIPSFQGIQVGMLRGSAANNDFRIFCQRKNIVTRNVEFTSEPELRQALKDRKIDAILSTTLNRNDDVRSVSSFAIRDFYFISNKENQVLLDELDDAIEAIQITDLKYEPLLMEKHFRTGLSDFPVFSLAELAYIKKAAPIRIVYNNDWAPISYTDPKTGTFQGLAADLLDSLSKASGLHFIYTPLLKYSDARDALRQENADILATVSNNEPWLRKEGLRASKPLFNLPVVMVQKISATAQSSGPIVMPRGMRLTEYIKEKMNCSVEYRDSWQECLEAVNNGEAQKTFTDMYLAQTYIENHHYTNLRMTPLGDFTQEISLGLPENTDPILLSILDRTIATFSDKQRTGLILENSLKFKNPLVLDLIYRNPLLSLSLVAAIATIIILLLLMVVHNKTRAAREIYKLLYEDPLTRAWNFNKFKEETRELLNKKSQKPYVFLYININKFKLINDTYGYETGDTVLKTISAFFLSILRPTDFFARVHSDHFVALFSYDDFQKFQKISAVLLKKLVESCQKTIPDLALHLNVGAYRLLPEDNDFNGIMDRANYAREQGEEYQGNKVIFYDQTFHAQLKLEKELESYLPVALAHGEFLVFYQPKVDCLTEKLVGAEALIRWNHKEKGLLSPGIFIPAFEKSGSITEIDFYAFEKVCQYLKNRKDSGQCLFPISCNFSRLHLANENFVSKLSLLADRWHVAHQFLEIEITETVALGNIGMVKQQFQRLKEKGFSISIDDFGAGYSSLNLLSTLPIDVIKIDRSFIVNIESSENDRLLLSGIVSIARSLGKKIVCEGVETQEQLTCLKKRGCTIIQGFFYAKPLPESEFTAFAVRRSSSIQGNPESLPSPHIEQY